MILPNGMIVVKSNSFDIYNISVLSLNFGHLGIITSINHRTVIRGLWSKVL